jgi:DNA-binding NarL/FixJ family response regulator
MVGPAAQQQPELLERDADLAAVDRALDAAGDGVGSIVVFEGPPGIGKTSLLDAAADRATARGLRVQRARGRELESSFSFGVVRQLLGATLERDPLDGLAALAAPGLGRGPAAEDVGDALFATLHGLHAVVAGLAADRPLVLVVDDLHWADAPSRRMLAYLAARISELRVTLLLASWPIEPGTVGTAALVREDGVDRRSVAPLGEPAVGEALTVLLSSAPSDGLVAAAHGATGGNPFLVHALGHELAGRGGREPLLLDDVAALGPRAVAESVLDRIAAAPDGSRALAEAVAVLGEDHDRRHAAALAELSPDRAGVAADALVALHVLAPGRALHFTHPLVRSAVLGGMGEADRAARHARAARLRHAAGDAPELVAAHLAHVVPAGDGWTVDRLVEAAAAAGEHGAPTQGIAALRRALAEPPAVGRRATLLASLGRQEARTGDVLADQHLTDAIALTDDPVDRAAIAIELGAFRHMAGDSPGAAAVLRDAAEDLGDGHRELRLALAAGLQGLHRQTSSHDATLPPSVRFAPEDLPGESPGERAFLVNVAMTEVLRADPGEQPLAIARRVLRALQASGRAAMASLVAVDAAGILVLADERDEATDALDETTAAARERGDAGVLLSALTVRSVLHRNRGELASAFADAEEADGLAREAGLGFYGRFAVAFLIDGLLERDRVDDAEAALVRAGLDGPLPDDCAGNAVAVSRARLRAAQDRRGEAIADLREAGARLTAAGMENPAFLAWRSELALLLHADGEPLEARRLVTEELRDARHVGVDRPLAIAALTAAAITPRRSRLERLEHAVELVDAVADPATRVRARVLVGEELARLDRHEDAREPLRDALDLAVRCGAVRAAAQAKAALLAAGGRPRNDVLRGPAALTPAELRVAQMAAEGLTNSSIAEHLVVVPRTVEMHLTAAFRKLGVAARSDLAAALAVAASFGDRFLI